MSLSFSLMAYHLPQRYLAALLSAARSSAAAPGAGPGAEPGAGPEARPGAEPEHEQVKGEPEAEEKETAARRSRGHYMGLDVSELQFGVRFGHVRCAFDFSEAHGEAD